ncbi:MAG TPA: transcriptional repressor LexA [Candidatus Sulfotelmatobacter sp.]|nr:transcriptional repressor LexA [Candidatus Sulfotelmatobacter sp.]
MIGQARRALTARQRQVLNFVRGFAAENGYPPTVREIGAHFGFVPRSVFDHLKALERKGYLRRRSSKSRSLEILDEGGSPAHPRGVAVPILGRVAAGDPLLAVQNIEGSLWLSPEWVNGGETFLLRVQGESMVDAHILPGDYALVRRQASAEHGDIVVALLNEEATVKRLLFKGDQVLLKAENPAMKPIAVRRADPRLQIVGKVIGVLRRL